MRKNVKITEIILTDSSLMRVGRGKRGIMGSFIGYRQ